MFQGRFKSILVDREAYLLALCRDVERKPVAAGLVARPEDWPWSSCRAQLGWVVSPDWLNTAVLHAQLLEHRAETDADRQAAAACYADLVGAVRADDTSLRTGAVRGQVFMGDDHFVARMQSRAEPARLVTTAIPKAQRGAGRSTWAPVAASEMPPCAPATVAAHLRCRSWLRMPGCRCRRSVASSRRG